MEEELKNLREQNKRYENFLKKAVTELEFAHSSLVNLTRNTCGITIVDTDIIKFARKLRAEIGMPESEFKEPKWQENLSIAS